MDEELNGKQLKALALACFIFVVSLYFSWTEIRYLCWSQVVLADVEEIRTVKTRENFQTTEYEVVDYTFTDAEGERRQGHANRPDGVSLAPDEQISIRYLPGDPPVSRLADDWNWVPFLMLAGSTIGLGWFLKSMHDAAHA